MNKKTFTPAIIFLALAVVAIIFVAKSETGIKTTDKTAKSDIVLFYGDGCSYCKVVETYLETENVESKISFDKREVYNNQANATLMTAKAKSCGLNTNSIGVPFLWDGENCLIGDRDIIAFFEAELATLDNLEPENGIEIKNFEATTFETENVEVETEAETEAETIQIENVEVETEVKEETLNENE
ncbi:hypothetical protein GW758_02265 [Candidatus Falkowbacteria bacterium]|nr:hypothetical protein [Candidatus Falkowbacteria bacterium]